jgi:hypothetical protein
MRILFLDDMEERYRAWWDTNHLGNDIVWAKTAEEAIAALAPDDHHRFDLVTLDHDLADEHYQKQHAGEDTGQEVAKFIVAMPLERRPKRVKIHSWNRDGALAMKAILHEAGIDAPWVPFNGRRENQT